MLEQVTVGPRLERIDAVGRGTHHFDVVRRGEELFQPRADHDMIIDDHHANLRRFRFRSGRHRSILSLIGMVTWTLVPVPGLDRTWSEPWRSAASPANDRSP